MLVSLTNYTALADHEGPTYDDRCSIWNINFDKILLKQGSNEGREVVVLPSEKRKRAFWSDHGKAIDWRIKPD
jgi:hypothetical protein